MKLWLIYLKKLLRSSKTDAIVTRSKVNLRRKGWQLIRRRAMCRVRFLSDCVVVSPFGGRPILNQIRYCRMIAGPDWDVIIGRMERLCGIIADAKLNVSRETSGGGE